MDESRFKITLAAARVNAGMTQEEAAKKMKVSKNTIVNWEKAKVIPRVDELNRLCFIYNAPPELIFLNSQST